MLEIGLKPLNLYLPIPSLKKDGNEFKQPVKFIAVGFNRRIIESQVTLGFSQNQPDCDNANPNPDPIAVGSNIQ